MDKKALIAKQKNEIRFQENQILYMEGKITWEEFENGLISEKDFNIKKERLNNRIIKICE